MGDSKLNNGIPVEENPLTLNSKIEYLNGLAVKSIRPELLISQEEQDKILNNQAIVDKLKEKLLYYQNRGWETEDMFIELLRGIYFTKHSESPTEENHE